MPPMRHLLPLLLAVALLPAADEDYSAAAPTNQRPMLGIEMSPVPSHVQEREGLTPRQGVLVQSTYGGTAAEAMALQRGDVVLGVNGAPITSMTDLRNEVGATAVGDPIQVTVSRNGQVLDLSSSVKEWPASIPYEKLDSASEKRFRDWQQRRQNRQAEELARISREADDLRRQLAGEEPRGGSRRSGAGNGNGNGNGNGSVASMPAVRIRVVIEASSAHVDAADAETLPEVPEVALLPGLPSDRPWVVKAQLITL